MYFKIKHLFAIIAEIFIHLLYIKRLHLNIFNQSFPSISQNLSLIPSQIRVYEL
jgi:hypothetical protein